MAYPDICLSPGSTRTDTTQVETDQAEDGTIRARSYFSKRTYVFVLVHEYLSATDYNTLMTFITNNYGTDFDFTWKADGVLYTCAFSVLPTVTPQEGNRFTVSLSLIGTEK